MSDVTQILSSIEQGDPQAAEQLLPLVYEELRRADGEIEWVDPNNPRVDLSAPNIVVTEGDPQSPQNFASDGVLEFDLSRFMPLMDEPDGILDARLRLIHGSDGDDVLVGNEELDLLFGESGTDYFVAEEIEVRVLATDETRRTPVTDQLAGQRTVGPLDPIVSIPDPALHVAIAEALDIPVTESFRGTPLVSRPILATEMGRLERLDLVGRNITSLEGLQHATNLTELYLAHNDIHDLSPLKPSGGSGDSDVQLGPRRLEYLSLDANEASDIGPLRTMTRMEALSLDCNGVTDLGPLADMTDLRFLSVDDYATDARFGISLAAAGGNLLVGAALTDGIVILRYLFGFTGAALVQDALAPDAGRTDPAQIVAFLDQFQPSDARPRSLSTPVAPLAATAVQQPAPSGDAVAQTSDGAGESPTSEATSQPNVSRETFLRRGATRSLAVKQQATQRLHARDIGPKRPRLDAGMLRMHELPAPAVDAVLNAETAPVEISDPIDNLAALASSRRETKRSARDLALAEFSFAPQTEHRVPHRRPLA